MPGCEKCWSDAHRGPQHDTVEEYHRLLKERSGDKACTPEEQAGPDATDCPKCGRRTVHQYAGWCMACGYNPEAVTLPGAGDSK